MFYVKPHGVLKDQLHSCRRTTARQRSVAKISPSETAPFVTPALWYSSAAAVADVTRRTSAGCGIAPSRSLCPDCPQADPTATSTALCASPRSCAQSPFLSLSGGDPTRIIHPIDSAPFGPAKFIIFHNSSFLIHNSSFLIRNSSFFIHNSSFSIQIPRFKCKFPRFYSPAAGNSAQVWLPVQPQSHIAHIVTTGGPSAAAAAAPERNSIVHWEPLALLLVAL